MIITITIYLIIILLIIFKGFYKNIHFMKSFSVKGNTDSLATSIQLESLPFYLNMGRINLFALFINFFFLSFISISFFPNLIHNTITYCQDHIINKEINSDYKNINI